MNSQQIYGLIGYPLGHSLSPQMHNAAFARIGISAVYKKFPKKEEELESFFATLSKANIYGLNVTIPYKEKVLQFMHWESPEVRFTRAVNTIVVKKDNFLEGWNTDGIGFYRHLVYDLGFVLDGKRVAILGAGGAAKAVTDQLARGKVGSICIYDVDHKKSSELAQKLNTNYNECSAQAVNATEEINMRNIDLLINATPIGLKEADPCVIKKDVFHSRLFVYDLIYNPAETALLKAATAKGAATANGLGMLLYQGARSFELWTKKKAPIEDMRMALKEALAKQ